jgi:hypothetical protein
MTEKHSKLEFSESFGWILFDPTVTGIVIVDLQQPEE